MEPRQNKNKNKKILIITGLIILAFAAGIVISLLLFNRAIDLTALKLKSIKEIEVTVKNVSASTPKLSPAEKQNIEKINDQVSNSVKSVMSNYLNDFYFDDVYNINSVQKYFSDAALSNKQIRDKSKVGFPSIINKKKLSKIQSTISGKAVMSNMRILYSNDLKPVMAISGIDFKSSYLLTSKDVFLIKMTGNIFFEPLGDEWKIMGFNITSKNRLMKELREDETEDK